MTVRIHMWCCLLLLLCGGGALVAQEITEDAAASLPRVASTVKPKPTVKPGSEVGSSSRENMEQVLQVRREMDSLKLLLAHQPQVALNKYSTREEFDLAVRVASIALIAWFFLVSFYVWWAIYRYVYNFGLSAREWKVLYPEVYETWLDKVKCKIFRAKTYQERRDELITYRVKLQSLTRSSNDEGSVVSAVVDIKPFDEPTANPYQKDSFGLPPGTVRGVLALTALVMFAAIEGVNLYAHAGLEERFRDLTTVFQMVIAFYFGSRAVEVLQARSKEKVRGSGTGADDVALSEPPSTSSESLVVKLKPTSSSAAFEGSTEEAVLPASNAQTRFANFVTLARDETSALPSQPTGELNETVPLAKRVLALTASFETGRSFPDCFGGISGNFDKQGLSFGALQWNIGQGSIQPLWKEMREKHQVELKSILGSLYDEFSRMLEGSKDDQMRWALGIQRLASGRSNAWIINDDWKKCLRTLGTSPPMIDLQVNRANSLYQIALGYCRDYGLTSDRGTALMFDIRVQNGSVDRAGAGEKIRSDFELINPALSDSEKQVERMRIIARRRSEVSSAEWRNDVLTRKMTIAEGKGTVHSRTYDLEKEFAIRGVQSPSSRNTAGAIV